MRPASSLNTPCPVFKARFLRTSFRNCPSAYSSPRMHPTEGWKFLKDRLVRKSRPSDPLGRHGVHDYRCRPRARFVDAFQTASDSINKKQSYWRDIGQPPSTRYTSGTASLLTKAWPEVGKKRPLKARDGLPQGKSKGLTWECLPEPSLAAVLGMTGVLPGGCVKLPGPEELTLNRKRIKNVASRRRGPRSAERISFGLDLNAIVTHLKKERWRHRAP